MVGHLGLKDGTVLRHVKHGDLIANVLVLCLRCKDPLSDGSHVVIGLCWARERALCSAKRHVVCSIQSCSNGNEETATSRTELTYNCIYECNHDWKVYMIHTFTQTCTFHICSTGFSSTGFSTCIKYRTGSATQTPTFRNLMHTEEDHIQTHMVTLKPCFYVEDLYLLIKFIVRLFWKSKIFPREIKGGQGAKAANTCSWPRDADKQIYDTNTRKHFASSLSYCYMQSASKSHCFHLQDKDSNETNTAGMFVLLHKLYTYSVDLIIPKKVVPSREKGEH